MLSLLGLFVVALCIPQEGTETPQPSEPFTWAHPTFKAPSGAEMNSPGAAFDALRRRKRRRRRDSDTGPGWGPRAMQGPLGAALRINIRAGVTSPQLPGCRHGQGSAGTLAALLLAQGQAGLSQVTCLQLSQPDWEPAGENLLKSCSLTEKPCPDSTSGSRHLNSAVPQTRSKGGDGSMQAHPCPPQIPLHPPLT